MSIQASERRACSRVIAALVCCYSGLAFTATGPVSNCNVGYLQGFAPANTHLTAASVVAATATQPQYCRVDGTIDTVNNKALTFSVGLPTAWNDKFLMLAQGGFAGSAPNPASPLSAPGAPQPLAAGYATASNDTGHRGNTTGGGASTDASPFINHPDLIIDFGHRGNKVTVDAAKALINGYYQTPIKRSIFAGCSNGGRSTMIHSQRYPGDFDGYIVGAPAYDWPGIAYDFHHSNIAFFGKPGAWLPPAKVKLLSDAVLAACDGKDGVVDGLIEDPRRCTFNPRVLACPGADNGACLTPAQVDAVVTHSSDMRNSFGDLVSPRWLLNGDEGNATGMTIWKQGSTPPGTDASGLPAPVLPTIASPTTAQSTSFFFNIGIIGWQGFNDPNWNWRTFDLDKDPNYLVQLDGMTSAVDTNLMPAASRGAKFIFYHGWAEQALNPLRTIGYYDAVVDRYGKEKTDSFLRLFMVPGMQHCLGGTNATDRFDPIAELERWLDTGNAPNVMLASKVSNGVVVNRRPLCAYPKVAQYKYGINGPEAGFSPSDPRNFACVDPPAQ
jgi:hypothetical protein